MKIRKAKVEDLNKLIDLGYDFLRYETKNYDKTYNPKYIYTKDSRSYILKKIRGKKNLFLVAEDREKMIGFLVGSIGEKYKSHPDVIPALLEELFIIDNYRSKGIGQKMFKEFESWCHKKKVNKLRVDMSVHNLKAQEFYKRAEFKKQTLILEKDLI